MTESSVDFLGVAGGQNLLVLAVRPGDESRFCAGLIAEACLRGRPPFVAVLTDGSTTLFTGSKPQPDVMAATVERRSRSGMVRLGVPNDWFLMLGLIDSTAPFAGRKFDAVVAALSLIMWRRDCNVLVAPGAGDARPDYAACHAIATAVAVQSSVGLVTYPTVSAASAAARRFLRSRKAAGHIAAAFPYDNPAAATEAYVPLQHPGAT